LIQVEVVDVGDGRAERIVETSAWDGARYEARRKLMTTRRHSTLWPKMQTRDVIASLHAVPLRGRVSSVLVFNYI
jgi:hypothetical protein